LKLLANREWDFLGNGCWAKRRQDYAGDCLPAMGTMPTFRVRALVGGAAHMKKSNY